MSKRNFDFLGQVKLAACPLLKYQAMTYKVVRRQFPVNLKSFLNFKLKLKFLSIIYLSWHWK